MRLSLILPRVEPSEITPPSTCLHEGCGGAHFEFHQAVEKALRDTVHSAVTAHRYTCLRCQQTFRVYPKGVTRAQVSQRVKGLAVTLTPYYSHAVPVGVELWRRFLGPGSIRRLHVQEPGV